MPCGLRSAGFLSGVLFFGIFTFGMVTPALAQIHGVPASVTSTGFGGHFDRAPGIPASVSSTGSIAAHIPGNVPREHCCITPLFPQNPGISGRSHHGTRRRYGYTGGYYAVPYYVPYYAYTFDDETPPEQTSAPSEEYRGGPTIFDRRGPGTQYFPPPSEPEHQPAEPASSLSAAPSTPESAMPETILIFRDGHQSEVSNYAIVGGTLFDLSPGHYRKISLAELDLHATQQKNDERGVGFSLPDSSKQN